MKFSLRMVSSNNKTGPMPVSYSSAQTCPPSCALMGNGCYAEHGRVGLHWKKITSGERGVDWGDFLHMVRGIPRGTLWRHNVGGDLPGVGDHIDHIMMYELVDASAGRRGFTYTHKPMTLHNQHVVKMANEQGFTVNLSANNLSEVDALLALGVGPVVVVLPEDAPDRMVTAGGAKVTACPAETRDVQCVSCRACAVPGRRGVIGFRAHGTRRKNVNEIARFT